MNKLSTFAAYPTVAVIALASAFSAQAQSQNDPADQAAYGAMPAAISSAPVVARSAMTTSLFAGWTTTRTANDTDAVDHAAYGAMPQATLSLRTRAEVRAEAIAARDSGAADYFSEGGDPLHAALGRAKRVDAEHLFAARASVKAAQ